MKTCKEISIKEFWLYVSSEPLYRSLIVLLGWSLSKLASDRLVMLDDSHLLKIFTKIAQKTEMGTGLNNYRLESDWEYYQSWLQ